MSHLCALHPTKLSLEDTLRWTRVGVLAAFALLLSYFETFIPIPIPGVKLGLANIAILIVLGLGDIRGAFCVAIIKILASGFLFGNPLTMAYSAAGTLLAFAGMASLSRLKTMRIEMVSVIGALLHEAGQLLVASVLLGTWLVWYSAPVLLVAGCSTGLLCGIVASQILKRLHSELSDLSKAVSQDKVALLDSDHPILAESTSSSSSSWEANLQESSLQYDVPFCSERFQALSHKPVFPRVLLAGFLIYVVVVLHASGILLGIFTALMVIACVAVRVSVRAITKTFQPFIFILVLTAFMQMLTSQGQTPLVIVGPVEITQEALSATAVMMLRLACIIGVSLAFMSALSFSQLIQSIRWLFLPLNRLGVRTEGFVLALDTALQFVPILVSRIDNQEDSKPRKILSKQFWHKDLPDLVLSALNDCLELAEQEQSLFRR